MTFGRRTEGKSRQIQHVVVIHPGWLEYGGDICKPKCLANQDQADHIKDSSGIIESGGDFGKAGSTWQFRGGHHLVNVDR